MKGSARAEQTQQTNEDQVQGDDVIQQFRHDENQNAGDQRDNGRETQIDVHGVLRLAGSSPGALLK
jgi:hypothetical protein